MLRRNYELLLERYLSGQIPEAAWQEHLSQKRRVLAHSLSSAAED
jgi:hypothetical protein